MGFFSQCWCGNLILMNNMWGWSFKSKPSPLLVRGRVLLETPKKRQGLKDIAGHPYSLFSCEEALGVRQHVIFKNKATLLLCLWQHNVYDMLSLADWFGFYLFYSRWEMQFLLHWAGLWVWASDKPWLLPSRLRWHPRPISYVIKLLTLSFTYTFTCSLRDKLCVFV